MAEVDVFEAKIGDVLRGDALRSAAAASPFGPGRARMISKAPSAPDQSIPDPLGAVGRAHDAASSLASRIIELSELLCGPQLGAPGAECAKPPCGLLPALEERAESLHSYLNAAHDAITLIRNHLPPS